LAVAARQIITPNGETLLGFDQRDVIFHNFKVQYSENFFKLFLPSRPRRGSGGCRTETACFSDCFL